MGTYPIVSIFIWDEQTLVKAYLYFTHTGGSVGTVPLLPDLWKQENRPYASQRLNKKW